VCVSNYRPVSLTCIACEIIECIITSETLSYLHAHDVISKQQHAFLSCKCTESSLLECLNDWTLALHDRMIVRMSILQKHLTVITSSVTQGCQLLVPYGQMQLKLRPNSLKKAKFSING